MFDGPVADVALGLALLYLVLSLASSAITEWVAALLGLRARNLRAGVERLLGRDGAREAYAHPLIANLARRGQLPSYIAPETLAAAAIDALALGEDGEPEPDLRGSTDELMARIDPNHPLKPTLRALAARGASTVDELRGELAAWFDEAMARMSGWYKRRAQTLVFASAAVVTVAANASTPHVARDLWTDASLRASATQLAMEAARAESPEAVGASGDSFPLGWTGERPGEWTVLDWAGRYLGWLITVAAVSLGAPFWFDLLGKVARLRSVGRRPASPP